MHDTAERMKVTIEWPPPPSSLSIQRGEVHVWAWDYEYSTDELSRHIAILSPDEHSRMQRFRFERDRVQYAVCHSILRILLGRYLGLSTSSISFVKNEFDKPRLAPNLVASELAFNLSHTTRVGVLAIASGLSVGVDIEEVRPVQPGTVEQYFSAHEQASLARLKDSEWLEGFYNCWTRKEAILKAEGTGLNVRLDAFDVSLRPEVKAEVLCVRPDAGFTSSWHLVELRPASGFVGALATDASTPTKIQLSKFI